MTELDTHVVAWLHAGEVGRFPEAVRDRLEQDELVICPMVLLDLEYLKEIGRLTEGGERILGDLGAEVHLRVSDVPFGEVVRDALGQAWTRDPFDRMLAAHAGLTGNPLVTKDGQLLEHCPQAVWD